jgi:MscS family membrane protein
MQSIVDYANEQFGNDVGIYAVIGIIFLFSITIRQMSIFLLPKIFSRAIKKSERFARIEENSRSSISTAMFGLIAWKLLENLPQIEFSGTIILWSYTISKIIFLIFLIRAALKMIDGITIAFGLIDKDGVLDPTEKTLISALESLMRFIIFVFGILFISETFGFDITTLIAGLGIGGLALALAAKDSISNIFGAISVLIDQPFRVGDWIVSGGIEGEVIDIRVRTTLVRTSADTIVTLPNASLVNSSVENFGKRRWRRYQPLLHLDLDTEPDAIESLCKAIQDRIISDEMTTNRGSSFASVEAITAQSIDVKLNVYWNVNSSVEERNARQELLLDIARFAKERKIDFFEPRVRSNR